MKIKKAISAAIIADTDVTDQLGTYKFNRIASRPAVFTSRKIPDDCGYPAVLITQVSGVAWGVRDSRGGDTELDVDVFSNKTSSDKALNDVCGDIWRLLDRVALTITGYSHVFCIADPPIQTSDEDGFPGYTIRCRVKTLET